MMEITEKLDQLIQDYPLPIVDLMRLEKYLEHDEWGLVFEELVPVVRKRNWS